MARDAQDTVKLAQQYDLLANKFKELYLSGKERGRESMSVALEKAREQLTEVKAFSKEHGEELKQYLSRDLDESISFAQQFGTETKEQFNPARIGAGALSSIATILEFTGDTLHSLSVQAKKSITFKTGEITSAGTLTCQACSQELHLKHTGHIPPCPKCKGILFTKGY